MIFLGILWCFSHVSYAQQRHFVVGLENLDYLPYYQTNKADQKPFGYAIDLIELFSKNYSYSVQFKVYPVRRLLSNLLAGKIDFKYPDSPNWLPILKKSHGVTYSNSTVKIIDGILTLERYRELLLDEFTQLGTIRGFKPWPYLPAIQQREISLMEASSMDQLIRQLRKSRVQGIYINIKVGIDYAANNFDGLTLYWNKSLPFGRDNFSLSTINHPKIIEEFNTFMVKYRDEISVLKQKYNIDKS
ncbi:MAG: transporter substrate-binding domain-containing protein [Colwellia sp.]|nr:transporter substrate-binding domain-containing protein [Colwellia sp.]